MFLSYYYFHSTFFTTIGTFLTYFVSDGMLPWSCSVRDYNLTIRIYSSSCSSVIYDRDIYIVLGGTVTIYSIIIKYIYNTSILRYSGIGIWSELNTCWYYYLNCSCLTVSSASFLTYFISNGIFAWSESTWYVDLTCGRIYSSTCSAIIYDRDIYIVLGSRISTYSHIIKYICRATCLRYTLRSWINYYIIACYLYSSCILLTCLSCSCSVITYFIHYGIITCWGSLWHYNLTSISTCGDEAWYGCTCSRSYHTYSYIVWSRVSGSSIEAYIV